MSAERYIENNFTLPSVDTLEAIFAYCDMLSVQSQKIFSIPSLQMLQESLIEEIISPIGREWTSEGYIYDGLTGNIDMNPQKKEVAKYRLIELYKNAVDNKLEKLL